jgi:hypothetical protein
MLSDVEYGGSSWIMDIFDERVEFTQSANPYQTPP